MSEIKVIVFHSGPKFGSECKMAMWAKPYGVKTYDEILENSWKLFYVIQCLQEHVYVFIDAQYKLWSDIKI